MKKIILVLMFLFMSVVSTKAANIQIVALVNDDVITSYDFYSRATMALANANFEKTKENFTRITPVIINELIQESLKKQAAERSGIAVNEEDIDNAMKSLAEQNGLTLEEFHIVLEDKGISLESIKSQMEVNILWQKYIQKRIAPKAHIYDEEVEEFMQKLDDNQGKEEYNIEELFYPIDNAKVEKSAMDMLKDVLLDVNQDKDLFAEYISQFSKAPNGGKIGWVLPDALASEVKVALTDMEVGQVSDIIRTVQGVSVIKLIDKRVVNNNLNQVKKEDVKYKLLIEKVEILQRKKLRDLKDSAFIEVKIR